MGIRPVVLSLVLFLTLLLSVGCVFGGSEEPASLDIIDFGEEPPTPEPEAAVILSLSIDPDILVEVHFLHHLQVRLEGLRQVIRDLTASLDYSDPSDVSLDWVIEVHEVTRQSDEFFQALTSMEVPESQREQYRYIHVGMLETVQVAGYGADRLLAASVVVGPSGRSLLNMNVEEIDRFETLVRESRFYLLDAEVRIDYGIDGISQAIAGLGLR